MQELVQAVQADRIQIVPIPFGPGGKAKATVHMAVSDASGDSAVIEYLKGKPVIHHGPQYKVMTNSPIYSEQLKLNAYWSTRNRNQVLPGSIQSSDRFVRGSSYNQQLPATSDTLQYRPGSGIRAIQIEGNYAVQGNVNAQLRPAASITFLAPKP